MRKYEMSPGGISDESRLVDDAQTELLKFSKNAAEQMYSADKFREGISRIIKILCKNLKSETLRKRCQETLPGYAMRLFQQQRELVSNYAMWYTYCSRANERNIRGSKEAFETITENVSPEIRSTPFFKSVEFSIPDHAYNWTVPLEQYQRHYNKTIRDATVSLVTMDAKEDYSTNVNLRNIAEMTVRYEHQRERVAELSESGVNLVWIEPHANCSRRCEPYQGKLYSLDETEGEIDGIKYRPLSFATDNPRDSYTTRAGKTYQNGCIMGFNCRHKLVPYKKGNKPKEIPADVVARRRAVEEKQRAMERAIRVQKRKAIVQKNINPKASKEASEKAKQLTKDYEEFSREHNAPFYRERTSVFYDNSHNVIEETTKNNPSSSSSVLTNSRNDDILNISDIRIGKSVGAKAKNYNIELPNKEYTHLTEGTRVTHIQVIAGKGRERQIDELEILLNRFGGTASEWQKKKGIGYVDYNGESYRARLHWYEEPTAGKHKWKVKPDADGNWFIEDD